MVDYGIQTSTVMPEEVEILETKVFVATDIDVEVLTDENGETYTQYNFNYVEYTKDEYIKLQAERNDALEESVTDLELALCDIYESIL